VCRTGRIWTGEGARGAQPTAEVPHSPGRARRWGNRAWLTSYQGLSGADATSVDVGQGLNVQPHPVQADCTLYCTVQSFYGAVHPCRRLTGIEVALFFRAEDGRIALPGSAKLSHSYPGVDSKSTYRNGERLYRCAAVGGGHRRIYPAGDTYRSGDTYRVGDGDLFARASQGWH